MGDNNELNKENNYQNFIQLQKKMMESISKGECNTIEHDQKFSALPLDELFKFLEEHFNEYHEFTNLKSIMPFVHYCIERWIQSKDYFNNDIGIVLLHFLERHLDEKDLTVVLQIVHQILYCLKGFANKQIKFGKEMLVQLAGLLTTIENRKLVSNIVACLQLYMNMYPANRQEIIRILWTDLSQRLANTSCIQSINTEIDILIQLFDEFYEIDPSIQDDPTIVATIQQLLRSDDKNKRKFGYFLFKKMSNILVMKFKNLGTVWLTTYTSECIEQLCTSYILMLECLDEEKPHIILASLKHLAELVKSKQLQNSWLDILYIKILEHGNIDVLYWAMNFFLETFNISDLSKNVVKELLKASNSMDLYDHESHFLDTELFFKFLQGNLTTLYELLGEIDWESVPLYVWIEALYDKTVELTEISITYEEIINISSKVFALENSLIRARTVMLVENLFNEIINTLSMTEYITYIETLYKTTDNYWYFTTFFDKKTSLIKDGEEELIFNHNIYKIFLKNLRQVNDFITFLNDVPQKHHGWLSFIPFHYFNKLSDKNIEVLNNFHGIDLKHLQSCQLTEIINQFEQYLKPYLLSSDYKQEPVEHCRLAAVAFYVQQKKTFDYEDDETLKIIFTSKYNLSTIFSNLWANLCQCLENTNKILNTSIIDEFLKQSNRDMADGILKYVSKTYDHDTKNEFYETILEKYPFAFKAVFHLYVNPLNLSNQERFFNGELKKDKIRIEQLFCGNKFKQCLQMPNYYLNSIWISGIKKYCDHKYILYLLNCHKMLTEKYPRSEENSNEYRIKLRIAIGVLSAKDKIIGNSAICNEIWNILLNENNQLIVCYIYEHILGFYDKREHIILEKLNYSHSLTSNQQVSLMSVTYNFCMQNEMENDTTKEKVISNLHALTMCDNSETRLFAKLFSYKLLKSEKFTNILNGEEIMQTIEISMQTKLSEYLFDIRLQNLEDLVSFRLLYNIFHCDNIIETLLFVTNASFDPFCVNFSKCHFVTLPFYPEAQKENIIKCRNLYIKKYNKISETEPQKCLNDHLELYKLSRQYDVMEPNNLIIYPEKENANCEILIVASLIDKLPILNTLTRNCNVLGIANIIINSKILTKQEDVSKNLSKSAEKSLNIIDIQSKDLKEYLINKQQLEDYKIVASEETSNIQEITNFKFPQKCILLLGHEKYGLPVSLSAVIDHTFKTSQLDKVHTLNVQETGVFCMWKFYEQHLINKT